MDDLSNFSENSGDIYGMGGDNDVAMAKTMNAPAVKSVPELTPGQQKITSNVSITYEIK